MRVRLCTRGVSVSAVAVVVASCASVVFVVVSKAFAGSEHIASAVGAIVVYASGECECGRFSALRV